MSLYYKCVISLVIVANALVLSRSSMLIYVSPSDLFLQEEHLVRTPRSHCATDSR
jgi:hypothetical protein